MIASWLLLVALEASAQPDLENSAACQTAAQSDASDAAARVRYEVAMTGLA